MRQTRSYLLTAITLFLLLLILIPSPSAAPASVEAGTTITVSTPQELRDAIIDANSETGDYVGADTIHLAADITFSDWINGADGHNATSSIRSEIVIEGHGYTIQRDPSYTGCPDNNDHDFRLFRVRNDGHLTLNNVTLRNGCANASSGGSPVFTGGAILNWGTLLISHSTISGNAARYSGGVANYGDGTLTINHSTISGNLSTSGGGVANYDDGTLFINHSTISGNSANFGSGGGVFNEATLSISHSTLSGNSADVLGGGVLNDGTLSISHSTLSGNAAGVSGGGVNNYDDSMLSINYSTLSGNSAGDYGGGVINDGTLTINHSTISGNLADSYCSGVCNLANDNMTITNSTITSNSGSVSYGIYSAGNLTIENTILADHGDGNCYADPNITSLGFNLLDDDACGLSGTGDLQNAEAGLLPLADNGGPTLTHALGPNSDALDAGSCSSGTDQRGQPRPVDLFSYANADNGCDIGAFESQLEAALAAPTLLAVDTACDAVEMDYLTRNIDALAQMQVSVYREVPGAMDEWVAGETVAAAGDGERYHRRLSLGRVYPAGTAFYVRIAGVDAVLVTPPQPCTP